MCFFGDLIRIPTTGLAVDQSYLDKEPQLTQTFIGILKESLKIIHENPVMLASVLEDVFGVDDDIKNETAGLYQQYYTKEGKTTDTIAKNAIDALCKSLDIATAPAWHQLYNFSN